MLKKILFAALVACLLLTTACSNSSDESNGDKSNNVDSITIDPEKNTEADYFSFLVNYDVFKDRYYNFTAQEDSVVIVKKVPMPDTYSYATDFTCNLLNADGSIEINLNVTVNFFQNGDGKWSIVSMDFSHETTVHHGLKLTDNQIKEALSNYLGYEIEEIPPYTTEEFIRNSSDPDDKFQTYYYFTLESDVRSIGATKTVVCLKYYSDENRFYSKDYESNINNWVLDEHDSYIQSSRYIVPECVTATHDYNGVTNTYDFYFNPFDERYDPLIDGVFYRNSDEIQMDTYWTDSCAVIAFNGIETIEEHNYSIEDVNRVIMDVTMTDIVWEIAGMSPDHAILIDSATEEVIPSEEIVAILRHIPYNESYFSTDITEELFVITMDSAYYWCPDYGFTTDGSTSTSALNMTEMTVTTHENRE